MKTSPAVQAPLAATAGRAGTLRDRSRPFEKPSRLLVQAPRSADLQGWLRSWLAQGPPERGGVRVQIDVDPQSFL